MNETYCKVVQLSEYSTKSYQMLPLQYSAFFGIRIWIQRTMKFAACPMRLSIVPCSATVFEYTSSVCIIGDLILLIFFFCHIGIDPSDCLDNTEIGTCDSSYQRNVLRPPDQVRKPAPINKRISAYSPAGKHKPASVPLVYTSPVLHPCK